MAGETAYPTMPRVYPIVDTATLERVSFHPVHAAGPEKRLTAVTMDMIRGSLLRYGLAEPLVARLQMRQQDLQAFEPGAAQRGAVVDRLLFGQAVKQPGLAEESQMPRYPWLAC